MPVRLGLLGPSLKMTSPARVVPPGLGPCVKVHAMMKSDDTPAAAESKRPTENWSVEELRAWKATLITFLEAIDQIAKARGIGDNAATDRLRLWISSGRVRAIQCAFWPSRLILNRNNLPREWCMKAIAYVEEGDRVGVVDGGRAGPFVDLREALFDPAEIRAVAHEAQEPVARKVVRAVKKRPGRHLPPWKAGLIVDATLHLEDEGELQQADLARFIMDKASETERSISDTLAKEYAVTILQRHRLWRSRK
jgi:hypothetical protein